MIFVKFVSMKRVVILFLILFFNSSAFSQAEEKSKDGYKKYYVILITKDGEVRNVFKEGKGITAKIGEKTISGSWYFKAEPDIVTVVGKKGEVLGEVKLNDQKNIKLETDEPKQSGGGVSIGFGIGPVGISSRNVVSGPRYISYNMTKNKAVFDQQIETREDKIRREYAEKKYFEQQKKEQAKQDRKAKRKKK